MHFFNTYIPIITKYGRLYEANLALARAIGHHPPQKVHSSLHSSLNVFDNVYINFLGALRPVLGTRGQF